MDKYLTLAVASELIGKSKETLRRWDRAGKLTAIREPMSNYRVYRKDQVLTLFADLLAKEVVASLAWHSAMLEKTGLCEGLMALKPRSG